MFNLSLTACSFHLRKTNSKGNTNIFNLNIPLTLQKDDGEEETFQDLSEIFIQFLKSIKTLSKMMSSNNLLDVNIIRKIIWKQ